MNEPRLVPRWFPAVTVGFLGVLTLGFVVTAVLVDDGLMSLSVGLLGVACGLLLVAACSALVRPRRRREPRPGPDGSRVFRAPALTVWPLAASFVVLYAVVALWAVLAVTDAGALAAPGLTLVTIAGAVALLPDLGRLLTGRLHRWRLEVGSEALVYRGYRTDLTVPWSKVGRASIQTRSPAGVLVNVRGEWKDPVVPYAAFDVPVEQLVEEIARGKAAARRS